MEPITTISQILSLFAMFLQERQGRTESQSQATLQDYVEWLRRCEHTEVITLLESNSQLMHAIQHLLSVGHEELIERFDRLEAMFAIILGSTEDWGDLAKSIDATAGLSDQAIEILRWFNATGASMAIVHKDRSGVLLVPKEGGGNYVPVDTRFFTDDMETLVALSLLGYGFGSRGTPNYTITRAAVNLINSLPELVKDNTDIPT